MNCGMRLGIVSVLASGLFIGCGKSGAPDAPVANSGGPVASPAISVQQTGPASNLIAQAAYDFVDAIVKGDTQRASARLTPQAMQRIIASKEQFAPTGLSTATFKLGEIRTPSPNQAVVQCVLTDSSQGTPQTEEMCCVLRKVDNDWRVAGIAYGTAADKPWVLNDFESGKSFPIPRQAMGAMANAPNSGQQPNNNVVQTGATQLPAAPQTAAQQSQPGMPPVAAQINAPPEAPAPSGLGMPAVAAPAPAIPNATPYQPQAPYTAQEPQSSGLR